MQALPVDTTRVRFRVLSDPVPHNEFGTKTQKVTAQGEPVFRVRVLVTSDLGTSEVVWVKVPGLPEDLGQDELCELEGLRLVPWANNGASGVAYWCDDIVSLAG
jgi:hypothetical protein